MSAETAGRKVEAVLLVDPSFPSAESVVRRIRNRCTTLGYSVKTVEVKHGDPHAERFVEDIRSIAPQKRGRIRTAGGITLPLSGKGKLNTGATPIVIIYDNGKAVDVYPKKTAGVHYTVFEVGDKRRAPAVEEIVRSYISARPEAIEPEWEKIEEEVDTGTGRADLVIYTQSHRTIVECKDTADQESVGQLSKQSGLKRNVRLVLACTRVKGNILDYAGSSGINVYVLSLTKLI